jgi:hypothetical protein
MEIEENKWICERCGREYDLEEGDGWVTLVDDEYYSRKGKLSPIEPYEKVCYECADELYAIVEECDKDCWNCEATRIWGLSIMDCLRFQLKFELIKLPEPQRPLEGSLEEAKQILKIFDRF